MIRIALVYGLISGFVVIGVSVAIIAFAGDHGSVFTGYLTMLVGLSSILVAVRQYRNETLGGVIGFWPALGLGLAIAATAGVAYALGWEFYLAATHYTFMDKYVAAALAAKRAAGVSGEAYAKAAAELSEMAKNYANPFYRLPMTFLEIFPVGVLVALASAALLRNPRFLPAWARPAVA
jgi:hypothetical protein